MFSVDDSSVFTFLRKQYAVKLAKDNTQMYVTVSAASEFPLGIFMVLEGIILILKENNNYRSMSIFFTIFFKPKTSAIYHTHSERSSLHDVTIKEKASKCIVTFKYKTMAHFRLHLFQVKSRCEMLIETITIIVGVFALLAFVSLRA